MRKGRGSSKKQTCFSTKPEFISLLPVACLNLFTFHEREGAHVTIRFVGLYK